jgi:acetyltransferase-like isoleucine patch superfamily enzyme
MKPDKALESAWLLSSRIRGYAWGKFLHGEAKFLRVDPGVRIRNAHKVAFGAGCWLKERVLLDGRSDHDIGLNVGHGVTVRTGTYIDAYGGEGFVCIGDRVGIGQYVYIGGNGGVTIGPDAMISGHTYIVAATHLFNLEVDLPYHAQGETREGIVIGRNAWIAANCVLIDGVEIGENSVIGAGSVVTRNVPANVVAVGCPARVVRDINLAGRRREGMEQA